MDAKLTRIKPRYFRCDCDWPYHALYVGPLLPEYPELPLETHGLALALVTPDCFRMTWRERLRLIWSALRGGGGDVWMSEIILSDDELLSFIDHIGEIGRATLHLER